MECFRNNEKQTNKQTSPFVAFHRFAEALSSACNELEKSEKTIQRLQEQQESAREFLNMKHFALDTDSKLARYIF